MQNRGPQLPSSFLFGIPTAARGGKPSPYLLPTLHSLLLQKMDLEFRVLVYVVDQGPVGAEVKQLLAYRFPYEMATGKLVVVTPSTLLQMLSGIDELPPGDPRSGLFYPAAVLRQGVDRCRLQRGYGDSLLRVLWRSKVTLDAAHLIMAASHISNSTATSSFGYYIHLEDDTPLTDARAMRFLPAELRKISSAMAYSRLYIVPGEEVDRLPAVQGLVDRPMLLPTELGLHNGFIGIVLRVDDLAPLAQHLIQHFDAEPVDWLFSQYFRDRPYHERRYSYQYFPSLFTHRGAVSSRFSLDIDVEPPHCSTLPPSLEPIVCWKQCDLLNLSIGS